MLTSAAAAPARISYGTPRVLAAVLVDVPWLTHVKAEKLGGVLAGSDLPPHLIRWRSHKDSLGPSSPVDGCPSIA